MNEENRHRLGRRRNPKWRMFVASPCIQSSPQLITRTTKDNKDHAGCQTPTCKQSLRPTCSWPGCMNLPELFLPISNGNLMEIINYRNRSTGAEIYYCVDCWRGLKLKNNARCATKMKYLLHSYSPSSFFFKAFFSLSGKITKLQKLKTNQFAPAFLEILLNNSL